MELIDRAVKILTILSNSNEGMSIIDIATQISLPSSTTHRILNSLKDNHLVTQDADTKRYRIGYKFYSLFSNAIQKNSLIAVAKPIMRALAASIQKTIVLCVKENDHIINIYCVEQENSNMFMVKTGIELPLFSTSAGRVYCAYMETEAVKALYQDLHVEANTPQTKTSWGDLERELVKVKQQGYACIDEELQIGMQGYACPILDMNQRVAAALAFTSIKRPAEDSSRCVQELQASAARISENLV